jgi:hypothetical protein
MEKHPIYPERVRKIPRQFSWVDHRLVREHHIDRLSHPAAALYLFLVTVGDARGLSYYSDGILSDRLGMDGNTFTQAREELTRRGLIAYKRPLYQILPLDRYQQTFLMPAPRNTAGELQSFGTILKRIGEGAP